MDILKYKSQDKTEVLELFKLVFKRQLSEEYWKWLDKNPAGEMIRNVMKDENKIVGYYSLMPIKLKYNKKIIKSAVSMTTMTHPEYRRKGIFTKLARKTYADAKNQGVEFIYGFPNKNSYPGFINRLEWFDICNIPSLNLYINKKNIKKNTTSDEIVIEKVLDFKQNIDDFLVNVLNNYPNIQLRNRKYLNWRYQKLRVFEDKPKRDYSKFIARNDKKIVGYMVLKIFEDENAKKLHIVDILANSQMVYKNLTLCAINHAKCLNVDLLSLWMLENTNYFDILKKIGFQASSKEKQPFCGYLNSDKSSIEFIKNKDYWFITMGDSDVF